MTLEQIWEQYGQLVPEYCYFDEAGQLLCCACATENTYDDQLARLVSVAVSKGSLCDRCLQVA